MTKYSQKEKGRTSRKWGIFLVVFGLMLVLSTGIEGEAAVGSLGFVIILIGIFIIAVAFNIDKGGKKEELAAKQEGNGASVQNVADGIYYEKDNLGTRQETMSQAIAYWMGERMGLSVKPPFTLFTMPSAESAKSALLELPFMHEAGDSGKIICERLMTYGYYETTLNDMPTGKYEVLVAGNDLTLDEYNLAEEAFKRQGGICKNHDAPEASVKADDTAGDASKVTYRETVKGNDGTSVYEVYNGPDKACAIAFLKNKPITRKFYYVVVDTPEGSFGRDINGLYKE